MKRRKQLNKRERKRKREGDGRPEGRKERKRENGALAPLFILLYRPWSLLCVYLPIYLVRNPLPVDVSIVGRTTSNIVLMVVFSLPQSRCLEVSF
jgi:hypothetical protein